MRHAKPLPPKPNEFGLRVKNKRRKKSSWHEMNLKVCLHFAKPLWLAARHFICSRLQLFSLVKLQNFWMSRVVLMVQSSIKTFTKKRRKMVIAKISKEKLFFGIVVSKFDAFTTTYKWRHNITSWVRISEVVWSSYNAKRSVSSDTCNFDGLSLDPLTWLFKNKCKFRTLHDVNYENDGPEL